MDSKLIIPFEEKYEEYLIDESKMAGTAESISFPESEKEIIKIMLKLYNEGISVTIQGGKTGIVGGAVPRGGHVMNLSQMNKCKDYIFLEDGTCLLKVEPGMNLIELKKEILRLSKNMPLFWPPEPTETSATVGGIASCNSKGICTHLYGDTKKYINAIRMVCGDGSVKNIERGNEIRGGIDLIDLVLGTEGILGVFSQLTLKLIPKPQEMWGISFFYDSKKDAAYFIDGVKKNIPIAEAAAIAAIEYIDRNTIEIIENRKSVMSKLKEFPDIETQFQAMIYIEIHGEEEEIEEIAETLMEIAAQYNCDIDKAWAVSGETEIEKMRAFRHAAAETANLMIEENRKKYSGITKLSVDMCLENEDFYTVLNRYEEAMESSHIRYCIFGHALGNHLHVNILPSNKEEFEKGKTLMRGWAEETATLGGKIFCEHGIGKLKKNLFQGIISNKYLQTCKMLKKEFDSDSICNKGNIF